MNNMEFDISKVYTTVNADELKPGDRVILADNLGILKDRVDEERPIVALKQILDERTMYRFVEDYVNNKLYALAYLVEHPLEKKWRPYKDSNEMIEDFKKRYTIVQYESIPMWHPVIWVKEKSTNNLTSLIAIIDDEYIRLGIMDYSILLSELFEKWTYMDGSPCGIKEE